MASHRRKNLLRRRVEDEGDEEVDDDSLSEGSVSDEEDAADGSETSQVDESPLEPKDESKSHSTNGVSKANRKSMTTPPPKSVLANGTADTEMMLNGLKISESSNVEEVHYEDLQVRPVESLIPPSPAIVEVSTGCFIMGVRVEVLKTFIGF